MLLCKYRPQITIADVHEIFLIFLWKAQATVATGRMDPGLAKTQAPNLYSGYWGWTRARPG
jgi:hypothetical protein